MMSGGGELGSMTPVMMTGAGCELSESKKPAAEPKWKGKNLYLTSLINTSIWGIKAFEDNPDTGKVNQLDVILPTIICKLNLHKDCALPIGMGIVKFNKKVHMVGGEFTDLNPTEAGSSFLGSNQFQSSEKVYEFDPTDKCFREVPDYALPLPMPQPIVANIMGKVYVLHGDHFCNEHGRPEKPSLAFQVLEFNHHSGSYYWETLPPPAFYTEGSPEYSCYCKHKLGVIGHRLFIYTHYGTHIFDVKKQLWDYGKGDLWPLRGLPTATTLSSMVTSSGPYLKKTKIADIGHGQDRYFIVVGCDYLHNDDRVFATVVNDEGVMSDIQWLPNPFPDEYYPFEEIKVIELLEDDEQEDGHLSNIFCVVYVSVAKGFLGLSVFRVSLLSPMVVVESTDRKPYLCREDKKEGKGEDEFLEVENLETRCYSMEGVVNPFLIDAFFL
ncbi:unnamed protein product [Linum tenue]|uniref:Uncharacterized protein n=1 Tax=Linum tenue TaxID=586396 RepID=A0AAV0J2E6_9ROSI|nr:unnamed protein product [Linum tenue]